MNKKNDCDIVKDLAVGYMENLLSDTSIEYVKEHLANCSNCQNYYQDMKSSALENMKLNQKEDSSEVDYLKKVKKHINWLRFIVLIIVVSIIVISLFYGIKYIRISNILGQSFQKLEEIKELDNYKISRRTIYKVNGDENSSYDITRNTYYINGKYKIEHGENSTSFLEDDSNSKIWVYDDLKQIDYYTQNYSEMKKGSEIDSYYLEINKFKSPYPKHFMLNLKLRKDVYNGTDCYVLREGGANEYSEIWIDAENYMLIRKISKSEKYYTEDIYSFEKDVVKEEDVDTSVLETDKYIDYKKINVEHNLTDVEKKIFGYE